jgi:hypothetical protein
MGNSQLPESRASKPNDNDTVSIGEVTDPHAEWVAIFTRWLLNGCVTIIVIVALIEFV